MAYAHLLRALTGIANEHGYCLALHGSMTTDFDILLCPWTEDATDCETVVEAIRQHVGGFNPSGRDERQIPTSKPHGRRAWAFYFDKACAKREKGPYLDISVMPRPTSWF